MKYIFSQSEKIYSRTITYYGAKLPGKFIPPASSPTPPPKKRSASLPPPSIPAKAGISFSQQREFSAKRNIAMVACRRMRLRRRDSGFRRNGSSFNFAVYLFSIPASSTLPFPRKRESSRVSGKFRKAETNVACRRMRLSPQRFPPSREWKKGAGMEEGSGNGMRDGSGSEGGNGGAVSFY